MAVSPQLLRELFSSFYKEWKDKKLVFAMHRHADIDALASSYVLSTFFPKSIIAAPDEMNSQAKQLAQDYNIAYEYLDDVDPSIPLVAVDTSHPAMLPQAASREVVAIFDHHQQAEDNLKSKFNIIDSEAKATAEIVAIIAPEELGQERSCLLAIAILSDTARFIDATERTLDTFVSLYKACGKTYIEILREAFPPKPLAEKKAVLQALSETRFIRAGERYIAYTKTSLREGEVATYLAEAGDIGLAFVDDERLKATRISARANRHIDIELNRVMADIGKHFGGNGGGHKKAAGCIAPAPIDEVMVYALERIKAFVEENDKAE